MHRNARLLGYTASCLLHPEAAVYPGKEIDFFSAWYDRGHQWYERQADDIGSVKARGGYPLHVLLIAVRLAAYFSIKYF